VRIALLPLEDYGQEEGGGLVIQGTLEEGLTRMGYEIADPGAVKRVLLAERVRQTGMVSLPLAQLLAKELGVRAIMVGAVTAYRGGDDPEAGLVCRLVDVRDGRLIWGNAASAIGSQFETVMGLGKVRTATGLVRRVVDDLLEAMPPPEELDLYLGGLQ